jgi:hypothetical protein
MSSMTSGRAYIVTSHGTLERVVQKRMAGKKMEKDEAHDLKIIFPKTSADSIKHKMMFKGRYKMVEATTSLNLRDHADAQSKSFPKENDNDYQKRTFNIKRWC